MTTFTVTHEMPFNGGKIVFEDVMEHNSFTREYIEMRSQVPYKIIDGKPSELTEKELDKFHEWFDWYTRSGQIDDVIQEAYFKSINL